MLIAGSKRVAARAGVLCRGGATQTGYKSNTVPIAGSATMTWAAVLTYTGKRTLSGSFVFNSYSGGGWAIYHDDGLIYGIAFDGGVVVRYSAVHTLTVGLPSVVIVRLAGNALQAWVNGVSSAAQACVGYTVPGAGTSANIGTLTLAAYDCQGTRIYECIMLDGYDVVASYNTAFGAGAAGLTAQWQEDLQQGRYLTDPTAGGLGAGYYYWSARDVVGAAGSTKATWTDRGPNAVVLNRTGSPQGGSVPMVF